MQAHLDLHAQALHLSVEGSLFLALDPRDEGEGGVRVGSRRAGTEGSQILSLSLRDRIPAFQELGA